MQTPNQQRLTYLLQSPEAKTLSPAAAQRLSWIVEFIASGQSISETCMRLGIARSTFHRWLERFNPNDLSTLEEKSHEPLSPRTSEVGDDIVQIIRIERERSPLVGKERIREILKERHAIDLSASSIGRIIERECLYFGSTPLHLRKRMQKKTSDFSTQTSAFTENWNLKSDVSPVTTIVNENSNKQCDCLMCKLRGERGRHVRRFALIASLFINIAFAAMVVGTALWESKSNSLQADILQQDQNALSSIPVFSLDGR